MREFAPDRVSEQVATFGEHTGFRQLLERLPVGAYTCDAGGLITYFNPSAVQLWGREPKLNDSVDRFCGSWKLFAKDGTPITHDRCWMALALETESGYNGQEIVIERPDGQRVTALAHANPLHDESGRLIGAVNVLVDLSGRAQAEETQALLAAIVESTDDAIVSESLDGRILTWNSSAERVFGRTVDEAIGQPISIIVPADRHGELHEILDGIRAGKRIDHFETVRVTKDGRQLTISLCVSPIHDPCSGAVIGASSVLRDISERKQSEQALMSMKDELSSQVEDLRRLQEMSVRLFTTREVQPTLEGILYTSASVAGTHLGVLWLYDPDSQKLDLGASLGMGQEFLDDLERIPLESRASGACYRERRRIVIDDLRSEPADDAYAAALLRAGIRAVHCTPLITRAGDIVGVLTVFFRQAHRPSHWQMHLADLCARQAVDFIENARLYAQLREADRARNEFLAVLAHELRNPLAPVRNATRILHLAGTASVESTAALDVIERQMVQMARLIDDLLDVARITGNKLELRREPVALAEILRIAVETSGPLISERGLTLVVTEPPGGGAVMADPTRLAQVVSNLLNNAAKFTPPPGHIWLTASREGSDAVIAVRDTGVGISPAALPRIFDLFTQGVPNVATARSGLGIGLTLVKRLVEMHGGRVEARSDGPGQGSEFRVKLPLLLDRAPAWSRQVGASTSPSAPPLKVLAVDDNRDSVSTLAMLLELMGHEVQTAEDGLSALDRAERFRPDVVLLDIGLPGLGGHEVARRIRQQPWGVSVVMIAMTGWSLREDRERSKDAGFDYHLVKPADPAVLARLLTTADPRPPKARPDESPASRS